MNNFSQENKNRLFKKHFSLFFSIFAVAVIAVAAYLVSNSNNFKAQLTSEDAPGLWSSTGTGTLLADENKVGSDTRVRPYNTCGTADGKTYPVSQTDFGNDTFCTSGATSNPLSPVFPDEGTLSRWQCRAGSQGTGLNYDMNKNAWSPQLIVYKNELYNFFRQVVTEGSQETLRATVMRDDWVWADGETALGLNEGNNQIGSPEGVVEYNGELYAAWTEKDSSGQFRTLVKKYNGTQWTLAGSNPINLATNKTSGDIELHVFNGSLYAIWNEAKVASTDFQLQQFQIRVKKLSGSSWQWVSGSSEGSINKDTNRTAWGASAVVSGGKLYVFFSETSGAGWLDDMYVRSFDGSSWSTPVNIAKYQGGIAAYPHAVSYNNTVYVAWSERNVTGNSKLFVKYLNNGQWDWASNDTNGINYSASKEAALPKLSVFNGNLYAFFTEANSAGDWNSGKVFFKKYNGGTSWQDMTPSSPAYNTNATSGEIYPTVFDGKLYATWWETDSRGVRLVRVKYYDGSTWHTADSKLSFCSASRNSKESIPVRASVNGEGGSVSPELQNVAPGRDATIQITTNSGFNLVSLRDRLLLDGSFEKGKLSYPLNSGAHNGGTLSIDSSTAKTGTHSLKFVGGNDGPSHTLPWDGNNLLQLDSNRAENFVLSLWAKSNKANASMRLHIFCKEANENAAIAADMHGVNSHTVGTEWAQYSLSYTCPAKSKNVSIRVDNYRGGDTLWLDDMNFYLEAKNRVTNQYVAENVVFDRSIVAVFASNGSNSNGNTNSSNGNGNQNTNTNLNSNTNGNTNINVNTNRNSGGSNNGNTNSSNQFIPQNVVATANPGSSSIFVRWDPVQTQLVTGYKVYRAIYKPSCTTLSCYNYSDFSQVGTTNGAVVFLDTDTVPGTTYVYVVTSIVGGAESLRSEVSNPATAGTNGTGKISSELFFLPYSTKGSVHLSASGLGNNITWSSSNPNLVAITSTGDISVASTADAKGGVSFIKAQDSNGVYGTMIVIVWRRGDTDGNFVVGPVDQNNVAVGWSLP